MDGTSDLGTSSQQLIRKLAALKPCILPLAAAGAPRNSPQREHGTVPRHALRKVATGSSLEIATPMPWSDAASSERAWQVKLELCARRVSNCIQLCDK